MINLKALIAGALLFASATTNATDYLCPVMNSYQNLTCEGSLRVTNLSQLQAYRSDLGLHKNKIKNLIIDFDLSSSALSVSTPCQATVTKNHTINVNGNFCLHGDKGVVIEDSTNLQTQNLRLETSSEVIIQKDATINAYNLELISNGIGDISHAHIREGAHVNATNFLMKAFDKSTIGKNSNFNISDSFGLYSLGDDVASIGENTKITSTSVEINSVDQLRLANVVISASDVVLNANNKCVINAKNVQINASSKLGNCFLQSSPGGKFTANITQGGAPLTVIFDASKIVNAKVFVWTFGTGDVVTNNTSKTTYTYTRAGTYTATLKYSENINGKNLKTAGSIQVRVKEIANLPPVASLSCAVNYLLINCNALASYDPEGQPLSFHFDYGDSFLDDNTLGLSSHAYDAAGLYTIKLIVTDSAGASSTATTQVQAVRPPNILPSLVLNCSSNSINQLDCNANGSADSDGSIFSFQYNWGDNSTDTKADSSALTCSV
jgi:PKD repeat protein